MVASVAPGVVFIFWCYPDVLPKCELKRRMAFFQQFADFTKALALVVRYTLVVTRVAVQEVERVVSAELGPEAREVVYDDG